MAAKSRLAVMAVRRRLAVRRRSADVASWL